MNFIEVPDCSILEFRCPCSWRHLPRKAQHGDGGGKATLTIQSFLLQAVRMNWGGKKNYIGTEKLRKGTRETVWKTTKKWGADISQAYVSCSQGSQGTTGLDVAMGLRWLRMQPRFIVIFKELRLSKWRGDSETPMHNTKDRAALMGPGSVRMSKVLGVWDVCRWPKPWLHGMSVGLLPDPLTGNWRDKTQG